MEAGEPRETSFWTMESPSTLQSEDLYILYVQVNPVYSMHRKIFYAYGESCSSACVDTKLRDIALLVSSVRGQLTLRRLIP